MKICTGDLRKSFQFKKSNKLSMTPRMSRIRKIFKLRMSQATSQSILRENLRKPNRRKKIWLTRKKTILSKKLRKPSLSSHPRFTLR